MSLMIPCSPGSWELFSDPEPELPKIIKSFSERCNSETLTATLCPTDAEKESSVLTRFLIGKQYELESAYELWLQWVKWRHEVGIDSINYNEIKIVEECGIIQWRGKDKWGRKCLVITGRLHNPRTRKWSAKMLKQYILYTVDKGVMEAEKNEDCPEVCILYDRRGLSFDHLDSLLHSFLRPTLDSLRDFYSPRLGVIYILYTNWLYWTLYHLVLRPFLSLFGLGSKVQLSDHPRDLFAYFNEEDLLLTSEEVCAETEEEMRIRFEKEDSEVGGAEGGARGGEHEPTGGGLASVTHSPLVSSTESIIR